MFFMKSSVLLREFICFQAPRRTTMQNHLEITSKSLKKHSTGPGLGPSPGWGPVQVGAHMGPILLRKSLVLIRNHKIVNKDIKGVKSKK